MSVTFEGYERRIDKINGVLANYGIKDLEDARAICLEKGVDCNAIVKGIQPICLKTQFGHTPSVAQSQSKRTA